MVDRSQADMASAGCRAGGLPYQVGHVTHGSTRGPKGTTGLSHFGSGSTGTGAGVMVETWCIVLLHPIQGRVAPDGLLPTEVVIDQLGDGSHECFA